MGILDGIVAWIAEQVMHGLDLISTSVLGALGCELTAAHLELEELPLHSLVLLIVLDVVLAVLTVLCIVMLVKRIKASKAAKAAAATEPPADNNSTNQ